MIYRFPVTVTGVFERKEKRHIGGAGPTAVFDTYSAGWYIQLDGLTSVYVGMEKPDIVFGDKVVMKLERSQ